MSTRGGAVVTGAGRGLGRLVAGLLVDRGHDVLVTDRDGDAAAAVAAELGPRAGARRGGVRRLEARRRRAQKRMLRDR